MILIFIILWLLIGFYLAIKTMTGLDKRYGFEPVITVSDFLAAIAFSPYGIFMLFWWFMYAYKTPEWLSKILSKRVN